MEADEWRAVPGYEGFYEVSSAGRVRSLDRQVRGRHAPRNIPGRELRAHLGRHGYLVAALSRAGFVRQQGVHRLVAMAFHGPAPWPHALVRHLNGVHTDNRRENLAWGSEKQNAADRKAHGGTHAGEHHPQARLTADQVRAIRASPDPGRVLAERYGMSRSTIYAIRLRRRWQSI